MTRARAAVRTSRRARSRSSARSRPRTATSPPTRRCSSPSARKRNPRELAQALVAALARRRAWVERDRDRRARLHQLLLTPGRAPGDRRARARPARRFGRATRARASACMVEFVSANPTGPLHVGHGRQAALGDAICNLLETQGCDGDARVLLQRRRRADRRTSRPRCRRARRAQAGRRRAGPRTATTATTSPTSRSDFLAARRSADDRVTASGDLDDLDGIRQFAVAYLRHEQDLDLQRLRRARSTTTSSSRACTPTARSSATVQRLVAAGKTYEQDGALWLRTTDYGDDKDRVMRKSDGTLHLLRARRRLPHHQVGARLRARRSTSRAPTTTAPSRACAPACRRSDVGIPPGYPDYVLHKMVHGDARRRGGEDLQARRQLRHAARPDRLDQPRRGALLPGRRARPTPSSSSTSTWRSQQNDENPVYYVQYAHARICSVLRQASIAAATRRTRWPTPTCRC